MADGLPNVVAVKGMHFGAILHFSGNSGSSVLSFPLLQKHMINFLRVVLHALPSVRCKMHCLLTGHPEGGNPPHFQDGGIHHNVAGNVIKRLIQAVDSRAVLKNTVEYLMDRHKLHFFP